MVKTRLANAIGERHALAVYRKLAQHTMDVTHALTVDKAVYYSDQIEAGDLWADTRYQKRLQRGDDLGQRMSHAFADAFREGCERVCIIGTDCLELSPETVRQAFKALEHHDVVIGPAEDGGYYLLGTKQFHSELFVGKKWGSSAVFQDTKEDILRAGLSFFDLPVLRDVDREEDLPDSWRAVR